MVGIPCAEGETPERPPGAALHNDGMSQLKDRLRSARTSAMKARDELRWGPLRMVLTAVTNAEVAGKQARELSDDEIVAVLSTESKKRREAAEAFEGAGRSDSAQQERAEAAIITEYLPEQLGTEDIAALVSEVVAATGAAGEGMRGMGKVMGALQPRVRGRADGAAVAAEVRRQLGAG